MTAKAKGKSNSRRNQFGTPPAVPGLHLVDAQTAAPAPTREVVIKARTPGQRHYVRELLAGSSTYVVAMGPAGTGKTYLAVLYAIQQLRDPNSGIKKIVLSRPNVGAGDDLGFLPGDIDSKMAPWCQPLLDVFAEHYSAYQIETMLKAKIIEIAPLAFIRGRTFKNSIVILDESQNATTDQMLAFLTRVGEGSRYIITGDTKQYDRQVGVSGLKDLHRRLQIKQAEREARDLERGDGTAEVSFFSTFEFGVRDVVRHEAIPEVLDLYA